MELTSTASDPMIVTGTKPPEMEGVNSNDMWATALSASTECQNAGTLWQRETFPFVLLPKYRFM